MSLFDVGVEGTVVGALLEAIIFASPPKLTIEFVNTLFVELLEPDKVSSLDALLNEEESSTEIAFSSKLDEFKTLFTAISVSTVVVASGLLETAAVSIGLLL